MGAVSCNSLFPSEATGNLLKSQIGCCPEAQRCPWGQASRRGAGRPWEGQARGQRCSGVAGLLHRLFPAQGLAHHQTNPSELIPQSHPLLASAHRLPNTWWAVKEESMTRVQRGRASWPGRRVFPSCTNVQGPRPVGPAWGNWAGGLARTTGCRRAGPTAGARRMGRLRPSDHTVPQNQRRSTSSA